jgi:diguanylate cyclase (GGDEF)-like protein/PAS domain S-box-containing protein
MSNNTQALKILFVEDSPDDVELALRCLRKEGMDVDWKRVDNATDLVLALEDSSWYPEIILSDYSMPSFSGKAALEICRRVVPEIPFIFLSGTIGEELAIESIHNGATDYVLKENMRRLSSSIRRAVDDASKRVQARELEKERSRLIDILEATSDLVMIAHPDESLIYLNKGGRNLLQSSQDISELSMRKLFPNNHWAQVKSRLTAPDNPESITYNHTMLMSEGGGHIPVSMVAIPHRDQAGNIEHYSFIARDIRDREAFEKQIDYLANYDALTDLPNRALLADRTTQSINYRQDSDRPLAMLVINIDSFQRVNDGYGQEVGDELLKLFGARLLRNFSVRDTVARLSADSFAVLVSEFASSEEVILKVNKVQQALSAPFATRGRSIVITSCVGISMYPRDGRDFSSLLQHADVAMHRAKEQGDGSCQFYATEMTRAAAEKVKLETSLRSAMARNEFELHYQWQVGLMNMEIVGSEALIRWNHPEQGMIGPNAFIPVAEHSGLIHSLGEWVLYTACKQLKEWDKQSPYQLRVAVNVSANQFRSKGFPEMVEQVLQVMKLDPRRLELELTESVLLHDQEEAIAILSRLYELGVQIALDDFGTGYSNLSYLARLPIHRLKIDKSFVQRAPLDNNHAEIVRAIISLSEALGLRVIAEGIETHEQLDLLREYGCMEGQGYLFARPQPARVLMDYQKKIQIPDNLRRDKPNA